ncbi:MAG: ABC transporter ATP-binding protein/permease, partial [Ilumatobacteraceae bacterium]|nr:ABC transporter ATP-binding protein/permease [Ilumatobacteraceae bacterium]
MSVFRLSWRAIHHEPRSFWSGMVFWLVFFTMPAFTGYALGRAFDALSDGRTDAVVAWAVAMVVGEVIRMASIQIGAVLWTRSWVHIQTLLRANMLAAQLASGGREAGTPVGSAGESLTHFRDDTEDVAMYVDGLIDVSGGVAFTAIAAAVLGASGVGFAVVMVIPLASVVVVTWSLDGRIKRYRAADRAATAAVTGFVGDVMAAATTVKVNDASEPVLRRLAVLAERRRHTAVRDRVLEDGVMAFSDGAADVSLGLVLLVGAGAIASGEFGIAQLALLTAYVGWLSFLPRMIGRLLARRKQAAVAFDRMRALVAEQEAAATVHDRELPVAHWQVRIRPEAERPERVPLERLDVRHLTARYDTGGGIDDVSFTIERGTVTVVTGEVGSGKSTLLRAVLGLDWQARTAGASSGEVRWNGRVIPDRAAFLVPPNAAYLSQVPQLVSDSVADNIALGPPRLADVEEALRLAALDTDVAGLPAGVDTLVGPRGVRLSGGQRQRLATARALVHAPELLVLDDLSSALDVETELELWR